MNKILKIALSIALMGTFSSAKVYEDGEDGKTDRWQALGSGSISNIEDEGNRVILLSGESRNEAFLLGGTNNSHKWDAREGHTLSWKMKFEKKPEIYVAIQPTHQSNKIRYIKYVSASDSDDSKWNRSGSILTIKVSEKFEKNEWVTIQRDVEQDLQSYPHPYDPTENSLIAINGVIIIGLGMMDDIKIMDEVVIPDENLDPTANAGEDQTVTVSTIVTLDGTASTDSDGTITGYAWKENGSLLSNSASFSKNDFTVGTHTISLEVTDDDGATHTDSVTVVVNPLGDTTPPIITLIGDAEVNTTKGSSYNDAGATASDDRDGNISSDLNITSNVNTAVAGIYTVRYNVEDSAGNRADEVIRTVTVTVREIPDTTKPVITLIGNSEVNITKDSAYMDAGATANDDRDGNITSELNVTSNVNMAVVGTYTVRYNVKDSAGNEAIEVVRTVNVNDNNTLAVEAFKNILLNRCGMNSDEIDEKFDASTGFYDGNITCNGKGLIDDELLTFKVLTETKGVLYLHDNNLTNVEGLSNLIKTGYRLWLKNNKITNLDGLTNLTYVGGHFFIQNNQITDIHGLHNLTRVDGSLKLEKNNLSNVDGLNSLTYINADLNLMNNPLLSNVDGLESLTTVKGFIMLEQLSLLDNIDGLHNLTNVGWLYIDTNAKLRNIDGLSNLQIVDHDLFLGYNPLVSDIDALSNLISVGELIYLSHTGINNIDILNNVIFTEDNVNIFISNNTNLTNISGLNNLGAKDGSKIYIDPNQYLIKADEDSDFCKTNWDLWDASHQDISNNKELICEGDWNEPPTANTGVDKNVTVNQSINLVGTGTDNDGSIVSYEWKEGSEVLADTASFDYTPTTVGEHNLTLTVTDDDGAVGSDSVIISSMSEGNSCDESTAITREELKDMIINSKDVIGVNTCKITDMSNLFAYQSSFNQDISGWDVSNVTNMSGMFAYAKAFNQPLDNWDTSNVTNMYAMFGLTESFNQPINNWNVSNVTDMSYMFAGAKQFNQPLDNWDTSKVVNMGGMFEKYDDNEVVFNQPLNSWDTSSVTNMSYMFDLNKVFNQPLNNWNTSNVTNMRNMFFQTEAFNQPINSWDVSNVTDISYMFAGAKQFNQPLDNWNTSKVTNMAGMFEKYGDNNDVVFNQPLNSWDTSSVTNMSYMFDDNKVFNQPLNNWNTSNVTNMRNMFWRAEAFNQPIGNWDTSNVTEMRQMFTMAKAFNQNINEWDVSHVTNMQYMFNVATAFNQPLDKWDVSNITNMDWMFCCATNFNQDIKDWDVANVTVHTRFSDNSSLEDEYNPFK